jgi:hypothetical protein
MATSERKEEILEIAKKASSEDYETSWDEKGVPISKEKTKVAQGKKSRQAGAQFELRVRKDLEEKGFVVDKWSNNFDLETKQVCPAKRKFNPFSKVMTIGTGFPDFIAIKRLDEKYFDVIGVEVKLNGILSKEEKEKCKFLLEKGIFNEIWIAEKDLNGRSIIVKYNNFKERFKNY